MSYSLTKTLPSCLVERKLLLELEAYVQRKVLEFASSKGEADTEYAFTIVDSSGVERLASVEDFKRPYFPDDTSLLTIKCGRQWREGLSIEIKFTLVQQVTTLDVSFEGTSAREVAKGIAAEIVSILESYKTHNYWFHSWRGLLLLILVVVTIQAASQLIIRPSNTIESFALNLILSGLVGVLGANLVHSFKPYSTFETRRNERRKRQLNWILLGLLGFILFTVVGVYFRQKLFGF